MKRVLDGFEWHGDGSISGGVCIWRQLAECRLYAAPSVFHIGFLMQPEYPKIFRRK